MFGKEGSVLKRSQYEIAGIVLCILLWLVCLSPAGMHLKPSDPGIVRGGLAIALWVVVVICFLTCVVRLLFQGGKAVKTAASSASVRAGSSAEQRLLALKGKPAVGPVAEQALSQLATAKAKADHFRETIRKRFGQGSLTAARYEGVLEQSMTAISENAEKLSEQLELFDGKGYEELSRSIASGSYKKDAINDELQEERFRSERQRLKELKELLDPSEEMLLRLDRCAAEVASLSNADNEAENERILEEIQNLIDTTKFYQSK